MKKKVWTTVGATAAAAVLVFGVSVNVSPAFAQSVEDIPVIGDVARVLTLRKVDEQRDGYALNVDQPMVADESAAAAEINAHIDRAVEEYLARAQAHIDELREAFLATGGTEEEFNRKNLQVSVDYEVLSQSEETLSFVLSAASSDSSAYTEKQYYNLDLSTGAALTLRDLLGDDWVNTANAAIQSAMERSDVPYFTSGEGKFETVDENTAFYIAENGNPVVVFPRYAIAPGGYGEQEFEILR